MVRKCPQCSFNNRDDASFCSSCGASMAAMPAVKPVPSVRVVTPMGPAPTAPLRVPPPGMCFYHPNLPAVYICSRCGRPICRDDSKAYMDLVMCPQCYVGVVPGAMAPPTMMPAPAPPPMAAAPPPYGVPAMGIPWMPPAPRALWGFIFSLAAGILIIVCGAWLFYVISTTAPADPIMVFGMDLTMLLDWARTIPAVILVLSLVLGLCVILGAFLTFLGYTTLGGIIAFICALFSIIVLGGFVIGMVLGMIGGILGILQK